MPQSVDRKLVFRCGETGFLLDLDKLVEICEKVVDNFDPGCSDPGKGIIGAFNFRQMQIPVVDPGHLLGFESSLNLQGKKVLVLKGAEGSWAVLVDQVVEIAPSDKFQACEIPTLLKSSTAKGYTQVSLCLGEPMVHFESERFYGAAPIT